MPTESTTKNAIDISIKLALLAVIIGFCAMLLYPFALIILWAIILAIAISPLYLKTSQRLGNSPKSAAALLVGIGLTLILVPSFLFVESIIEGVQRLKTEFEAGTLTIPPPDMEVRDWPLIGEDLYNVWNSASVNLGETLSQYQEQFAEYGALVIEKILSTVGSIFQFVLATIIAGILLVVPGTRESSSKLFRKFVGDKADDYLQIVQKTVNNVVKGVLGVALIQAFIIGIGLLLAGVPYAGLWTLAVFIIAVLQLPAIIVVLPAILWLFSNHPALPAILWTIFLLAGGLSDNVLKPILLGKGAPVPMLVIFLGVLGGFVVMGFIGLFIGAIVLSLGYKLYLAWISGDDLTGPGERSETQASG